MPSSEIAQFAAERIVWAASRRGISVNKLLSTAGVSKSVVDRMKLGNMPSADKLAAVAAALDVPTEFLLGTGVFSKWDLILDHKTAVLSSIADLMKDLSSDLRTGVDDLSLIRLVGSFSVDVEIGDDPAGMEIVVMSPFATCGAAHPPLTDNASGIAQETKKEPAPGISENGRQMLELYEKLPERDQLLLLGRLQEMTAPLLGATETAAPPAGEKAV